MDALPIVRRELRVAARRKGVYRLRLAAGILTLGLGSYFLLLGNNLATTVPAGRTLFLIVSVLLLGGALAAAHETYDSISAEKREGPIGFLFLTELYPHDIVLGKLFAAALPSFYAMVATFPLLAAAALMGGVTGGEIWKTWLALLNLFFFAQSVAILASASFRQRGDAAVATVLILGFFIGGLGFWSRMAPTPPWPVKAFNPAYAFGLATGMIAGSAKGFWLSLAAVNVSGWCFIGVASLALPRLWHQRPEETGVMEEFGETRGRTEAAWEGKPFTWLARRTARGPKKVWQIGGVVTAVVLSLVSLRRSAQAAEIVAGLLIPSTLLKYWVASAAGRTAEEHRRNGLFELLLGCTPLTGADLLAGQKAALGRVFLGPMAGMVLLDLLLAGMARSEVVRACLIGSALQLPLDMLALGWVATWFAVSQKRPRRAAAGAYLLVCVAPNFLLCVPLGMALHGGAGFLRVVAVWVIVGAAVDFMVFCLARQKLRIYFRAVASGAPEKARKLRLFAEPVDVLAG